MPDPFPTAPNGKGKFSTAIRYLLEEVKANSVNRTPGVGVTRNPAGTSLRVKPVPAATPTTTGGDGYWR